MSTKTQLLKITQVIQETPDSVSLKFAVPEDLKDTFRYRAGQYITLIFDIKGEEQRRAYSMSSSPVEEGITVTVKKVKNGLVSAYINDKVKVGQEVRVLPPQGHFYLAPKENNQKCYMLFGAGSGITPLMSIIKTVLEKEPQSNISLLYGNRTLDAIIFKEQLDKLAAQYKGQFSVDYYLSAPPKTGGLKGLFGKKKTPWTGGVGRIEEEAIKLFLQEKKCIHEDSEYFVCGPGQMIDTVEQILLHRGINERQIHFERFTASKKTAISSTDAVEDAKLIAHLDDEKIELTIPKGKTILEVMLKNNVDAPFACKAGVCSSCIAKVKQGEVVMDSSDALDADEIKHGYILTCQAHPTTSVVEIDFDDL